MTGESLRATRTVDAAAEAVFAVLVDPATHAAIDGTGWVCEPLDPAPLAASGQVFGMAMYHERHPEGHYRVHNRVETFDPPRAVSWATGGYEDDGTLSLGGWIWRYDLTPVGPDASEVTLTYDWSAVPADLREHISFPPFDPDHLARSLDHLAALATSRVDRRA